MSDDVRQQIEEMLGMAEYMGDGPSKLAVVEEAVRLADTHGEADLAYDARQQLIHAATFAGFPEKALVAFTWCLAKHDRDDGGELPHQMLWRYKWIGNTLPEFPQITLTQIEEVFADMERRYTQHGMSLRPAHKLRCGAAMGMGDAEAAAQHHRAWQDAPQDTVTDCAACERNHRVKYLFFTGHDEGGVAHAAPIFQGRLSCAEIPHATLARVLLPLLRLGRVEEAAEHHRHGLRLVRSNRTYVSEMALHMTFLALTDNLAQAVRLVERHLLWALEKQNVARRFDFYLAARLTLARLQESGKAEAKLRLPAEFPALREDGTYQLSELLAWFDGELRDLAERFDQRNGTDRYARRIAEQEQLHGLAMAFPVATRRWKQG